MQAWKIIKNGVQKILDDSLPGNEYLKTFITEWTVEAGDTITLPIYEMQATDAERGEAETYFNYDFTVDYGDGTTAEITSFDDADRMHTYTKDGYSKTFEGINADISIYVPKGSFKPSAQYVSTTANITVIEYDVE